MTDDNNRLIDRRTVLKGLGVGAVGIGGATGTASAHHVQEMGGIDDVPSEVIAGEPFTFTVLWTSGHGSEACFVAAISTDGDNWTEIGRTTDTADSYRQDVETEIEATVPQDTPAGEYMLRVSATEAINHCPNPGETGEDGRFYVRATDISIPILPPVEVEDIEFKGCSEVWVAFADFPVDSTEGEVNVDGSWHSITIDKDELTKIPGQYGHDTPVFKYDVDGNNKLIGMRVAGEETMNDHRCAQNV